jgi:hypothetical protein
MTRRHDAREGLRFRGSIRVEPVVTTAQDFR